MGKQKPVQTEPPSKRNIDRLFRELGGFERGGALFEEYRRLDREVDELEKTLLDNPSMKRLRKRKDEAYAKFQRAEESLRSKVRKIRQRYFVNGLTPAVLKALNQLVKEINE